MQDQSAYTGFVDVLTGARTCLSWCRLQTFTVRSGMKPGPGSVDAGVQARHARGIAAGYCYQQMHPILHQRTHHQQLRNTEVTNNAMSSAAGDRLYGNKVEVQHRTRKLVTEETS